MNETMEAAATLAENIDDLVIPAMDTYRLAVIVAGAPVSVPDPCHHPAAHEEGRHRSQRIEYGF